MGRVRGRRRHPGAALEDAHQDVRDAQNELHQALEALRDSEEAKKAMRLELENLRKALDEARGLREPQPVPMRLPCPDCGELHVDIVFAKKVHHTHACQKCGNVWRPAIVPTVGVRFLPGFHDEASGG